MKLALYRHALREVQGPGDCPVALLAGYDATPDPGLRGPTNFVGFVSGAELAAFDAELAQALSAQRCAPSATRARANPRSRLQLSSALKFEQDVCCM